MGEKALKGNVMRLDEIIKEKRTKNSKLKGGREEQIRRSG